MLSVTDVIKRGSMNLKFIDLFSLVGIQFRMRVSPPPLINFIKKTNVLRILELKDMLNKLH